MALADVLSDLRQDLRFMPNLAAWQTQPARPARYGPLPAGLHPALIALLRWRDIEQLYTHQAQAVALALQGQDVAVVTPTASGKTLCYNLPVLHSLLQDPETRALYLFPTKALAQDQMAELGDWQTALEQIPDSQELTLVAGTIATYDGDTPSAQRARIRREVRLMITNPDMLHVGILPYHSHWADFFAGLRFIVIDEMHTYRGVFGSHVANVLRRLRRICKFYGSHPQFVLTSATIANPGQLASRLIERPVQVVDDNGAPQGEKHLLLYNPPIYDPARGLRRSSVLEAQELAARFLLGGVQTIVFGRSRLTVEVLLTYLRERLARSPSKHNKRQVDMGTQGEGENGQLGCRSPLAEPQHAIRGYRGGYLPVERRAIEAGLRSGQVRGVVATNALELGIDIGQLQAAILCGYPGTIASTWQQMGRAGRTTETSLALLVATGGALDQFLLHHPEFLLERSPEQALINPDNLMLLVDQLRCAAFELPFQAGETFGACEFTADALALLAEQGDLHPYDGRLLWSGQSYPARQISLRSAGGDTVAIQAATPGSDQPAVIGEIDAASAPLLVHEGAIYIHEGQSYRVEELDLEHLQAQVVPVQVDYYTDANSDTDIQVLAEHERRTTAPAITGYGDLVVSTQVTGYRRVKHFTHENLGVFPLEYPPQVLETSGYWIQVLPEAQAVLAQADQWRDSPNDYGPNWREQREQVRARDGYRCTVCGAPETAERQYDVHHLVPFRTFGYVPGLNENYRLANRLANLVLVCPACHQRLESGVRTRGGLDGLAYALSNLAPLYLMCDKQDIDMAVVRDEPLPDGALGDEPRTDNASSPVIRYAPRIYIFERATAGLGFSARLFELHDELLAAAQEVIAGCPCRHGCPACVGPVLEEGDQALLETKQLTLALVEVLRTGTLQPANGTDSTPVEPDFW